MKTFFKCTEQLPINHLVVLIEQDSAFYVPDHENGRPGVF